MKVFLYNSKYFISEVRDIFISNKRSNILSLISTTLIFFVLTLVIGGWMITSDITKSLMGEAEVSVYLTADISDVAKAETKKELLAIQGVKNVTEITAGEAYTRMEKVLGEDAKVLTYFDANPFEAFLEVGIDLEQTEMILSKIKELTQVASVRDNRGVLDKLSQLASLLNILSFVFLFAVGITTLVIVSHIIQQGIYYHKEQINTLYLLGAPKSFIVTPFYIEGIFMTVLGCVFALAISGYAISTIYSQLMGPLPFIPMPSYNIILSKLIVIILGLGLILGIFGSMMGVSSSRDKAE